jgi:hypothetical protein
MMKVFSLALFFLWTPLWACSLKRQIISLSAPITGALEELGLLEDKELIAVSLFHPVKKHHGEKWGGGIFLSQKVLKQYGNAVIFFDESQELHLRLKEVVEKVEIKTRHLDPFVVAESALSKLAPYLLNCERKMSGYQKMVEEEKKWHQSQAPLRKKYIFFLGEMLPNRWPEYVMANDGFVKFWRDQKKLISFPSELAYVRWGEKWKKELADEVLVGIREAEAGASFSVKRQDRIINISAPGALAPGIYQLRFMRQLWSHLD